MDMTLSAADSIAFAVKSEGFLRQILAKVGTDTAMKVELDMAKYLDDRGGKKLKGEPAIEIKDPMNLQDMF
jgi:nitrite reductase (cytochrome c-552)